MTEEQHTSMLAAQKDGPRDAPARPVHGILILKEIANGK